MEREIGPPVWGPGGPWEEGGFVSWAAVTNDHKLGSLKQALIVSEFWSQKSDSKVSAGPGSSEGSGGDCLVSSSFWWLLVSLSLWPHHSCVSLRVHGFLCDSVSLLSLCLSLMRTFVPGFRTHVDNPG